MIGHRRPILALPICNSDRKRLGLFLACKRVHLCGCKEKRPLASSRVDNSQIGEDLRFRRGRGLRIVKPRNHSTNYPTGYNPTASA
jgi:hypothetical protein